MILIQAVFTCMIEHRCMVPIIKWFYNSPDNSTIKIIKVTFFATFHPHRESKRDIGKVIFVLHIKGNDLPDWIGPRIILVPLERSSLGDRYFATVEERFL
jgi:hypothetical protein